MPMMLHLILETLAAGCHGRAYTRCLKYKLRRTANPYFDAHSALHSAHVFPCSGGILRVFRRGFSYSYCLSLGISLVHQQQRWCAQSRMYSRENNSTKQRALTASRFSHRKQRIPFFLLFFLPIEFLRTRTSRCAVQQPRRRHAPNIYNIYTRKLLLFYLLLARVSSVSAYRLRGPFNYTYSL